MLLAHPSIPICDILYVATHVCFAFYDMCFNLPLLLLIVYNYQLLIILTATTDIMFIRRHF